MLLPLACAATDPPSLEALGARLFSDPLLSAPRTQSCATCHDPAHGFTDARGNAVDGAASLGADGVTLGDRNTPSIAYAAAVPEFQRAADGEWRGGLFHDGRAMDLEVQAAEPPLNPREMALPDIAAVVQRLRAVPFYREGFTQHFGADIFNREGAAYAAMTRAIAAFERGPEFRRFDSRYDRYLRGEARLTPAEELGRRLFFSDLTNCMSCHLLAAGDVRERESFTDHRYHNIGLPAHKRLRELNGFGPAHVDTGLAQNPAVSAAHARGRFRTPSLRNVAVTAPYMHNGVFKRLETAIFFYNQYIVHNNEVGINPETGAPWGAPEVRDTIALELLRDGQPLDDERIAALVAFLRTLTDQRYEYLLPPTAIHTD